VRTGAFSAGEDRWSLGSALYVLHWLLFNYCMSLCGATRAFRAWLLLFYSQL